jgi:uncharacterized protein YndB with AHSA1/START domain
MTHSLPQALAYQPIVHTPDTKLDLLLERTVDVAPELVWAAWTTPALLMKWFTPSPWKTVECEIDLRPGGAFNTVMESPDGKRFPGSSCYLEIVPNRKLVWTSAMMPGYRPVKSARQSSSEESCDDLLFTAVISILPEGKGTRYSALAIHNDPESCKRHEDMGFYNGWGTVLDQLVALMNKANR